MTEQVHKVAQNPQTRQKASLEGGQSLTLDIMEEDIVASQHPILQMPEQQPLALEPLILSPQVQEGPSQEDQDSLINIPIELAKRSRDLTVKQAASIIPKPTASGTRKWRRRKGKENADPGLQANHMTAAHKPDQKWQWLLLDE